jgi:hypothetical protein
LSKRKTTLALLFLTGGALAIHGYHPYAEDAEIYLPGIEKLLHPRLFPTGTEFFESHAGLTLFPNLIAFSVRVTHLPFRYALFTWYLAAILLLLLACWQLAGICFDTERARWGASVTIATLLTIPIAGTALYIMDQYLNPRNLAAFAAVFSVCRVLEKRYLRAVLWLIFAAAVHPLMASFAVALCAVIFVLDKVPRPVPALALAGLPFSNFFAPPSPAYREAMRFHLSIFLRHWQWYEWLGLVAPIAILLCLARIARARKLRHLEKLSYAVVLYQLVYFFLALVITFPDRFEAIARLQPLRSLFLVYVVLLLAMGGLLAEFVLKDRIWRWLVWFLPLAVGMFLAQRELFPASAHVEWPWAKPRNAWAQAFVWIRHNTPEDALFAINPYYMQIPGEDTVGFRALAERSRLADASKDSGAVAMFPPLAENWWEQLQAQKNSKNFGLDEWLGLREKYGISWVVLENPGLSGLNCPYRNQAVAVCRLVS